MKKLLLCAALLVGAVCTAHAQEQKKISFGVRMGFNASSLSTAGDLKGVEYKCRPGFHVGAVMDYNIAKNLYLQPGLYFTQRGGNWEEKDEGNSCSEKINMNYIQIPVTVAYRLPVGENLNIDLNAGPYVAIGIGGTIKTRYSEDGEVMTDKVNVFKSSTDDEAGGDFSRFDAGLRFGAGVHIKRFYVGLAYDLGVTSLSKDKDEKIRNGSFQVSLGYNF